MAKRRRAKSESEAEWQDDRADSSSEYLSDTSFGVLPKKPRSTDNPNLKKRRKQAPREVADASGPSSQAENSYAYIQHPTSTHVISSPQPIREGLLNWYAAVHETRGMPWRKPFNPNLTPNEKAQRAYEVWISEIMLQQTQVATVIPYYNRWMEKFPTIHDLAAASIDEVNALWKGLGYYSRASRLLEGAKKAVKDFNGKLPDNAKDMEAHIPGIGRYSAGAICSIACGEQVPVLDGNVHRLLSRFLALHAPPKAKPTLDILWRGASAMVEIDDPKLSATQHPGDINQALIELGSTVCRPRDPECSSCPLRKWCSAYAGPSKAGKATEFPSIDIEDICNICVPLSEPPNVTAYPMKAERKKAREELDIVNVVEWRAHLSSDDRRFLLVRRPEGGLLAGLYEFPTLTDVRKSISPTAQRKVSVEMLSSILHIGADLERKVPKNSKQHGDISSVSISRIEAAGDVTHIFSHIKKTYRTQWVVLVGETNPPQLAEDYPAVVPVKKKVRHGASDGKNPTTEASNTKGNQVMAMWVPLNEVMETNAVLNLNKGASLAEVNERYRALSLIFHPDKQHDDPLKKEVATKEFLEIQKAYQVLSDPFTRQVYDELGPEAVNWAWSPDLRFKTKEEISEALQNGFIEYNKQKSRSNPNKTKAAASVTVNAAPLLSNHGNIRQRLQHVHVASRNIQLETSQIAIGKQTTLSFEGHSGLASGRSPTGRTGEGSFALNGTVRHQFSPRLTSQFSAGLLFPHLLKGNLNYEDPDNSIQTSMLWIPFSNLWLPPTTVSWTRKLFKKKHYRGRLDIHAGPQPSMAFHFIKPTVSKMLFEEGSSQNNGPRLRSESGLKMFAVAHSVGIAFDAFLPKLVAESSITFFELSARLKANIQWGLTGLVANAGVEWFNETMEVASNLVLSATAVVLEFNLTYADQRFSLPIMLSPNCSTRLALGAIVIPSTLIVIGYRFVLLPRQRSRRAEYLRRSRRMLEEDSDLRKERNAVEALLKERIKRIVKTESEKQGLIIQEATYGVEGTDEATLKLAIDVQGPLQALVRNSQLHIAGGTSKTAIQGFFDPAPYAAKILRVRYTFSGTPHYAEIPDYHPVVLPLAEHRLDD
ncbi:hypothetical protein CVT24_007662 [Panaeolus cyanescens]|uniref:Adenine DNA glycosylase n=1 Tax=Panaeolus cyanescens TaxID=181874 RepID=A0A409VRN4_9AGAR|nr:hypothetical protein CVT24_007662 [Panaeolus cyanescens]